MKKPLQAPPQGQLMRSLGIDRLIQLLNAGVQPTVRGRYRHWDSLRHLEPPGDLSPEEWWLAIKLARGQARQALPIDDKAGIPFSLVLPNIALEMLHRIDQQASGQIAIAEVVTTPGTTRRYVVDSLIEEAITSSQLEGASTTRSVAKEMIRTGRAPTNLSERMILNNFHAMRHVSQHHDQPLTPQFIIEVHRIVTEGTLPDADSAGRMQRPGEERVVIEDEAGELLHEPPPAEELPQRIDDLCAFANDTGGHGEFIHPVVRAIAVHFKLAYDHPFEDGNGRTARAIFYWAMLHHGYWLTEYLSISRLLNLARARYARSFLYSEQDDNDLTYFVLHHLSVIDRAIAEMRGWLATKVEEVRETEALLQTWQLNHRQSALLSHALRNAGAHYTHKSHATSHDVVIQSARNDLMKLVEMGLMTQRRVGKQHVYWPVRNLPELVKELDR